MLPKMPSFFIKRSTNHIGDCVSTDSLHQYNYKKVVKEMREADAKDSKRIAILIIFGAILLLAGCQVSEWIFKGYDPALLHWYIERAVGMMWVIIIFLLYQYTIHKTNYEKDIAISLLMMRAKKVAVDRTEKPSLEWAYSLKGRTYGGLNEQERAWLARLTLDKAYEYRDVFSESDLKLMAKAQSLAEFERLMEASSRVINHNKKRVLNCYQIAYP